MPPNWSGSITFKTAGATCLATTNSSATLEMVGVREIGLKCLLITLTGFCFVRGTMSASFQDGKHPIPQASNIGTFILTTSYTH